MNEVVVMKQKVQQKLQVFGDIQSMECLLRKLQVMNGASPRERLCMLQWGCDSRIRVLPSSASDTRYGAKDLMFSLVCFDLALV